MNDITLTYLKNLYNPDPKNFFCRSLLYLNNFLSQTGRRVLTMSKRVEIWAERGMKTFFKIFSICKKIGGLYKRMLINFDIKMRNKIFFLSQQPVSRIRIHYNNNPYLYFFSNPIPLSPYIPIEIHKFISDQNNLLLMLYKIIADDQLKKGIIPASSYSKMISPQNQTSIRVNTRGDY